MAAPHPFHLANAKLALENAKPVLVEKAMTMNAPEAVELVATARSKGLFLKEAMWTRFLPHVVIIREILSQGLLGEIVTVQADHGKWFAKDSRSRIFAPELGGSALLDLEVYPVSFASMILGTPDPHHRARRSFVHRSRRPGLNVVGLRLWSAGGTDVHVRAPQRNPGQHRWHARAN